MILFPFPDQSSVVLQVKSKGAHPVFVVQRKAGAGTGLQPQQKSAAEAAYCLSLGCVQVISSQ